MRIFNITDINYVAGEERGFFVTNLTIISACIKSIVSEIRTNGSKITANKSAQDIINADIEARVTALEP